jgi:hypothetical protein
MIKRTIPATHISAAMATSESAVAAPSRSKPGSMKSQIELLAIEEIASKARLVETGMTLGGYAMEAPAMRERMRNSLTSTVAKARELTGGTYTIEVGDMLVGGKLYIVAIVTRTE